MKKGTAFLIGILFAVLRFQSPAWSEGILIDDYTHGLKPNWEEKSFAGNTQYEVTSEDGRLCLKGTSRASASGLYYEIDYDTKEYPLLTWQWKVDHVLARGNAMRKDGDDYAARVYVIFPSILFWKSKALNYIWANRLRLGEAVPNPFTNNAIMIAVESGAVHAGTWREERRNVYEDFRQYFGRQPPRVGAIAIMTDTDNTGEEAVAWYGPISILKRSGP